MREELYLLVLIFVCQSSCLVEVFRMRKTIWDLENSVSEIRTLIEWHVGRMQNPNDPRYMMPPPLTGRFS